MKKIKTTLSIWITSISLFILCATIIVAPKIIKKESLESILPNTESYLSSICDNIDSTLLSYSRQLEQLNCYRIDNTFTDEEIGD